METQKPIKRSAAIVQFSKDHHFALLLVWKIREGLKKSIEPKRISQYVTHFYDNDLIYHFNDEEEILFKKLSSDNPFRIQAEDEHKNIKQLIDELRKKSGDISLLTRFAKTLEEHIRFEERELFNYIQQNISNDELAEMGASLKKRDHEPDGAWKDIFWEIKK
ncbi:hypothetical protein BH11BAC1_BH11BAC1_01310 [soil metagenome]